MFSSLHIDTDLPGDVSPAEDTDSLRLQYAAVKFQTVDHCARQVSLFPFGGIVAAQGRWLRPLEPDHQSQHLGGL